MIGHISVWMTYQDRRSSWPHLSLLGLLGRCTALANPNEPELLHVSWRCSVHRPLLQGLLEGLELKVLLGGGCLMFVMKGLEPLSIEPPKGGRRRQVCSFGQEPCQGLGRLKSCDQIPRIQEVEVPSNLRVRSTCLDSFFTWGQDKEEWRTSQAAKGWVVSGRQPEAMLGISWFCLC